MDYIALSCSSAYDSDSDFNCLCDCVCDCQCDCLCDCLCDCDNDSVQMSHNKTSHHILKCS